MNKDTIFILSHQFFQTGRVGVNRNKDTLFILQHEIARTFEWENNERNPHEMQGEVETGYGMKNNPPSVASISLPKRRKGPL